MKTRTLSAAIALLTCLSAHAVDATNLVVFPSSNPDRVILESEQGSYANLLEATPGDFAGYNLVKSWTLADTGTNYSLDLSRVGVMPKEVKYVEKPGGFQRVVTNVATSPEAMLCDNARCGGFGGDIAIEQTCRYQEVKISGGVTAGLKAEGMVKSNDASLSASSGVGASATVEWKSGWSSCRGKGLFFGCPAVYIPNHRSKNWPVTEQRSRFADYKVTDASSTLQFAKLTYQWTPPFTDNWYERAYKPICASLGGTFSYPTKARGINSDPPSCKNIPEAKRLTWNQFARFPYFGEGKATYNNCRAHTY